MSDNLDYLREHRIQKSQTAPPGGHDYEAHRICFACRDHSGRDSIMVTNKARISFCRFCLEEMVRKMWPDKETP